MEFIQKKNALVKFTINTNLFDHDINDLFDSVGFCGNVNFDRSDREHAVHSRQRG